jgi:hypothetical protein
MFRIGMILARSFTQEKQGKGGVEEGLYTDERRAHDARKHWWPHEICVVFGNGRFATVTGCRPGHVILWCSDTMEGAQDWLAHINRRRCGGRCRPWSQWHKCVDLMSEPESWPPNGHGNPAWGDDPNQRHEQLTHVNKSSVQRWVISSVDLVARYRKGVHQVETLGDVARFEVHYTSAANEAMEWAKQVHLFG